MGYTRSIAFCAQISLKPVKRTSTNWTQVLLLTFQALQTVLAGHKQPPTIPFLHYIRPQICGFLCVATFFWEMGTSTSQEGNRLS